MEKVTAMKSSPLKKPPMRCSKTKLLDKLSKSFVFEQRIGGFFSGDDFIAVTFSIPLIQSAKGQPSVVHTAVGLSEDFCGFRMHRNYGGRSLPTNSDRVFQS